MALVAQTLEHIRAVMLARLAGSPALVDYDTSPGSPWWLLGNAVAREVHKRVVDITAEALNCIPSTSSGRALWEWVATFLPTGRIQATAWVGLHVLQAEGAGAPPPVPIASEIVHADGTLYRTTAAVAAGDWSGPGGTVEVATIAVTLGNVGNKATGTVMALVAPPVGVSMTCHMGDTTTLGVDKESEDGARIRLRAETRGRPGSGKPADYEAWTLEGPVRDLSRVCVYPRYETPLDVIVVAMGTDAERGMISDADAAAILAYLVAEAPFSADVRVAHALGVGTDQLIEIAILPVFNVRAEPGWGCDWTVPGFLANIAAGSVEPQIELSANPTGSIDVGQHVVVQMNFGGPLDYRHELGVVTVGATFITTEAWPIVGGITGVPATGTALQAGGPLWQPIQNAIAAFFATRGPWPVDPAVVGAAPNYTRPRYPDSASVHPGAVNMSDLYAVVESVDGLESAIYVEYYRGGVGPTLAGDLRETVNPTVADPVKIYTLDSLGATIAWVV